jgi:hypothetical protein
MTVISQAVATAHGTVRKAHALALETVGGRARGRVLLTLAAVLGLSGADAGAMSVTTDNLERAFGVGNTGIGLLLSVVGLVGAQPTDRSGGWRAMCSASGPTW